MCGISGIIVKNNTTKINVELIIENLLNFQERRGPDASGSFIFNEIGLGHNRLAIQDIDKRSNQPFIYENLIMVFNGEIYNYIELKKSLFEKGIQFKTNSDTEVVFELFKYYGIDFVKQLRGMFSIVILDIKKKYNLFI